MKSILFVYGSVIGSFLPLLVERLITKSNFVWARSQCPQCQRILDWFELIPIISFIGLRGRCLRCHVKIPSYLLIYEVSTGLLFTLFNSIPLALSGLLLCLEIISLFDLFTFRFNSWWLIIIFSLAIWHSKFELWWLICIFITYLGLLLINQKLNWMGNGDLDVIFCLLVACPFTLIVHTILLAALAALFYCIIKKTKLVPFLPFLTNSLIVILFIESIPVTI
ncbi:prepilin peptidase [Fructilactobacillus frigidiflavus]|uniref:prepilin peptidase n=1 Tax=Fructilactobacillus frigidiflavus TaxID=3242688 RepID=UPI0037567562